MHASAKTSRSRAPDGPGDAAGPHVETIGPNELAGALGADRRELYRARGRGEIPDPDRATLGGFARWSVRLATEIVRDRGRKVPASWGAQPAPAAGGAR
jgi:hypothetical protein